MSTSKTLILFLLALGCFGYTIIINGIRLDGKEQGRQVSLTHDGNSLVVVHGKARLWQEEDLNSLPEVAKPMFFHPFSVNKAGPELLATVPGIGPTLALRITKYRRQSGYIASVEDLRKIKGIGEKKAELIMEYTTFDL